MKTLGKRISELRTQHHLTQKELGKSLNLAESTIAMYERDARKPDYDTLNKIATLFKVSTDYLLGRSNDSNYIKIEIDEFIKKQRINEKEVKEFIYIIMTQPPEDRKRLRKIIEAYLDRD